MKWQHCPKVYFLLISIYSFNAGGLLGAPVEEDILDQLLPVDTPVNTHTPLSEQQTSLSLRAPSSSELSLTRYPAVTEKAGKQEFEFPFQTAGKSLTAAVGLSINDSEMNHFLQSRALEKNTASDTEKSSTSSTQLPNVISNLVSAQPIEMVSNHSKHMVNTGARPLELVSTKSFLPGSSLETSIAGEKLTWHREVTTSMITFSNQPMIKSEGSPLLNIKGNLQNLSALDHTHLIDEMESLTVPSEGAESSTFKLTSVDQTNKTRSGSILSTTVPILHAFSSESDFTAHLETDVTSLNSLFKQLSTSWSAGSIGSPSSSVDNWQLPDVSEDEYSTAASSVGTSRLPDVSEDEYSTAASSVGASRLPDVSEDEYSTAASSVGASRLPDVSEDEYSTAASSVGTSRLPDVSEDEYSTAASSVGASRLPDVSEDEYSTAASSVGTSRLPDVSEDEYSTAASSVGASRLPDVSEDEYSTVASSVGTSRLPDVSEDEYSTVASSVGASRLPDVSEDEYSTAASSVGTSRLPDVFEGYSNAPTNWPSSNSEAEFSMVVPHTQSSILEEEFTTNDLPSSSEEYFSITSSPSFQPSASEALSSTLSNWKPNFLEESVTSLHSTNYQDLLTSSSANGIMEPHVSEVEVFTSTLNTVGTNPEAASFTMESLTLHSHIEQSTSVIRSPLLLQFGILNRAYRDSLSNSSSQAYQELKTVVKGTLDPIFHARYGDSFLQTKILSFANGSVKVESEVVFQDNAALPSSSDIVRTVLTHVYHKDLVTTDLEINASSVVCNGYNLANLEPEKMLIEFTALSTGFGPWSAEVAFYQELLQRISSWVLETLEEKYLVQGFNIGRVIRIQGDVNIQGTALLTTPVHVDGAEALLLLNNLGNNSVDLRSLKVNGSGMNFGVLPVSFIITNREYNTTLRDSRSAYFCSLGKAVTQALRTILKPKYSHFMQAVIKQFGSGSVISTGDLVFLSTPPTRHEVLNALFNSIDSKGFLAGTDFAVDAYSFTVGDARLDRPYERVHFPGFGIAIILLCGLAVISLPVLAFLCWKYRFCAACQKSVSFEAWDVECGNASVQIPLPEVNRESYRLHEEYVNYSFAP
ncbi:streptococcal hemagglutinin-like [Heterodontus francisci]|uniref:streptococcal hemagglutinin-like n=1 Tax=Heterodontus francisci TaxID=7792 RepID=UPI00355B96B9